MINIKITTPEDLKESAKRARAAQIEEERKPRIFNVKNRVIGVDVEALKKQMQEKKAMNEARLAEEKAYQAQQNYETKRLIEIEHKIEKERKRYLAEMLEYRKQNQKQEQRREFDLNDPQMKRKDKPCRLGDDDPRLTVSSIQRFEGEADSAKQRKQNQRAQLKAWLAQQIQEKKDAETARKQADEVLHQSAAATDARVKELEEATVKCRKEMERAVREFNLIMAEEKRAAKKLKQQQENEDVIMHINNMMNSELVSGASLGQPSQLALDKVIKTSYRGMNEFEISQIKQEQLRQIEEKKERERAEAQAESDWLNLEQVQAEKYVQSQSDSIQEKRRIEHDIREQNKLLAIKQKAHQRYLEDFVYKSSGPDSSFYDQFNRTTR